MNHMNNKEIENILQDVWERLPDDLTSRKLAYSTQIEPHIRNALTLAYSKGVEDTIHKVLKIVDDNDPQTNNKVNPKYWGKTLRDDIKKLSPPTPNQVG